MDVLEQTVVDEFVLAAHEGDLGKVKSMLAQWPDLIEARTTEDESALEGASHMVQIETVEYLLAAGAHLDIYAAAALGLTDQVIAFLRVDRALANTPGAHGIGPLFHAASGGHLDTAQLLLSYGADINAGGWDEDYPHGIETPLGGAARTNDALMAEWLLNKGALVNAPGYQGKTPLTVALEWEHRKVANVLRQYGGQEALAPALDLWAAYL